MRFLSASEKKKKKKKRRKNEEGNKINPEGNGNFPFHSFFLSSHLSTLRRSQSLQFIQCLYEFLSFHSNPSIHPCIHPSIHPFIQIPSIVFLEHNNVSILSKLREHGFAQNLLLLLLLLGIHWNICR